MNDMYHSDPQDKHMTFIYNLYIHTPIWLAFKIPGLKDYIKWAQLELKS